VASLLTLARSHDAVSQEEFRAKALQVTRLAQAAHEVLPDTHLGTHGDLPHR
jgi:hypothetical protein